MNNDVNISLIGKPNVGKSTIFNKLIGSDLSKVSETSGTTIFPIHSVQKYKNLNFNIIDLGGLKKKSKSNNNYQGNFKAIKDIRCSLFYFRWKRFYKEK